MVADNPRVPPPQVKESNPKDAMGMKKPPFSTVPMNVVAEVGVAMYEGAVKYGRHNYRDMGVLASVYFDGAMRHLASWWEGENMDPDSDNSLSHVTKAIASLVILRDAMMYGSLQDDRPPTSGINWMKNLIHAVEALNLKYPVQKAPHTRLPQRHYTNEELYGGSATSGRTVNPEQSSTGHGLSHDSQLWRGEGRE